MLLTGKLTRFPLKLFTIAIVRSSFATPNSNHPVFEEDREMTRMNREITVSLVASVVALLISMPALAGYDLTISSSNTDPDLTTSLTPVGLDSLFLWVKCADQGISALEMDVEGSIPVLSFVPRAGVLNVGTSTSLLLGIADCPIGDDIDLILGKFVVWDSTSAGGDLSLIESANHSDPVVTSCDDEPILFIPRIVGFASDGGDAPETGAEYGCGYYPEMPARAPSGGLPYEWSDRFDDPASDGEGTDLGVGVIRKMASNSNALIVAGEFDVAGPLNARGFAKLTMSRSGGQITTSWTVPTNWGQVTALPSNDYYSSTDSDTNGGMALAGTNFDRPFVYCPPSGSCVESSPAPNDTFESLLFAVEHWSKNGKYLVGGWFYGEGNPTSSENYGLAQFNPSTSSFERFGYPDVGEDVHYWVEPDGFGNGWVREILELKLPGRPLDKAVVIGGSFGWVFESNQKPTLAGYAAWLNPNDWLFYNFGPDLPGEPLAFAQSPGYDSGDGGTYLYVSGDFGIDEEVPGLELPSVQMSDVGGNLADYFTSVPAGGPPYPGPMKAGTSQYAIVTGMMATKDYLYVVGEFDRVLTKRGVSGDLVFANRFARFSFATQEWEALGTPAIAGPVSTIEVNWPAVFVGGAFTTVGQSIPSYHLGEADFTEAVGVSELTGEIGMRAPIQLDRPVPNPTRGVSHIGFLLPRRMHIDLAIFDVGGRRVRQMLDEVVDAGEHVTQWDGRTETGQSASAGAYFARLSAGDMILTEKIILVR